MPPSHCGIKIWWFCYIQPRQYELKIFSILARELPSIPAREEILSKQAVGLPSKPTIWLPSKLAIWFPIKLSIGLPSRLSESAGTREQRSEAERILWGQQGRFFCRKIVFTHISKAGLDQEIAFWGRPTSYDRLLPSKPARRLPSILARRLFSIF